MKKIFFYVLCLFMLIMMQAAYCIQAEKISAVDAKMNFNFKQIPVRDLLQLLAEIAKINLIISDDVTGVLTLHLQNVTWQEAFSLILKMTGLVEKRVGKVYFVADGYAHKKIDDQQTGQKNVVDIKLKLFHLDVQEAMSLLKSQTDLLSSSGQATVDARNNVIWLKDDNEHINRVKDYLQKIDVPDKQIMIEARVVNMDDHLIEQLGLHLVNSQSNNCDVHDLNISLPKTLPGKIGLVITKLADNKLLDLELTALENAGKCKIIACPKLMTQNRKPAYIESGEEIPYQEQTSSGATNISFKKAVLSLKATPYLTPDHRILLQLEINQNKVSHLSVNGTPGIQTQQVQTQVIVNDGQTVVLGGIFEKTTARITEKIPFLSSVPILGSLLGNHQSEITKKELLIFVTPKVVLEE